MTLYKCTLCGELWFRYELHGPDDDLRCGDPTCGGAVVVVKDDRTGDDA